MLSDAFFIVILSVVMLTVFMLKATLNGKGPSPVRRAWNCLPGTNALAYFVLSVSDEEDESVSNVDDRKRKKVEVNPEHAGEEEDRAENRSQVSLP